MAIGGSGLSKGGGTIWPSGPSGQKNIKAPDQIANSEGMHSEVSAASQKVASGATKPQGPSIADTAKADQATQVQKPTTQITDLTQKSLMQHLAKNNIPINKLNSDLALLMAEHGVELSEDNFKALQKLLKGNKSQKSLESAVLLMSKGLGDKVDDVNILNNLLTQNSTITKSLEQLTQMQSKMSSFLNSLMRDTTSLQPFMSAFAEFSDQLKKLKNSQSNNQLLFDKYGLLNDSMAMASFLEGLANKMNISSRLLGKYLKQLGQLNQNLLGQIILSQDSIKQPLGALESFEYFQIPNPLVGQAIVEMLLRKQAHGSKNKKKKDDDNPENQEKIMISMDTEDLGKVTVVIVVMGYRVWCTIHSDQEHTVNHATAFREELSSNLKKYQYTLEEFKSVRKKVNIKKFIAPTQNISDVKRIETEI